MRSTLLLVAASLILASGCASPGVDSLAAPELGTPQFGGAELVTEELVTGDLVTVDLVTVEPAAPPSLSFFSLGSLERMLYPRRARWQRWGSEHLQTGDLVFTRGNYYLLLGAINFSDFLCDVTGSQFSHVGIVAIEDGEAMVYDISDSGLGHTPFDEYVTQAGFQSVAVRRPLPAIYSSLPEALGFIRGRRAAGVEFDRQFALENDSLYCTELVVEAFAAGGVTIAEPQRVEDLEGLSEANAWTVTLAKLATGVEPNDPVYTIGTASSGLYGSPWLVEVLPPTDL